MTTATKTRRVDAVTPRSDALRTARVLSRPAPRRRPDNLLSRESNLRFSPGPGRSTVEQPRSSRPTSAAQPKPMAAVAVQPAQMNLRLTFKRLWRGETAVIGTFLACAAVFGLLGVAYLGVFANVQSLATQLRSEQGRLAAATSQQHDLMDQIGRLSSPDVIAAKAPQMHMELPTAHAFVDVPATGPTGPAHSAEVAANPTGPGL